MKKILIYIILFIPFLVSANSELNSDFVQKKNFEINSVFISDIVDTDDQIFIFKIDKIENYENINSWKIRFYCDDEMELNYKFNNENVCGQAIDLNKNEAEIFFITFTNETQNLKDFHFKLKAYDKNGDWLHTERKGFRWK